MRFSDEHLLRGIALVLTIAGGVALVHAVAAVWRTPERSVVGRWVAVVVVWWATTTGTLVRGMIESSNEASAEGARFDDVVSAGLAGSVIAHVLTRRREQMRARLSPDQFSVEESAALGAMVRAASVGALVDPDFDPRDSTSPTIRLVLDAVERPARAADESPVITEWAALLRVYGRPRVETPSGSVVTYRKSRALELTAWLAFNRDRRSRSAARTAIWDIEISDATFSTVVSDMRRALSSIDPATGPSDWLPTTYTDEINLSTQLTTDADLLRTAHVDFERAPSVDAELFRLLPLVRDVPFAGTGWSWADLDGTTTRLVILVVDASISAARFALEHGRGDLVDVAVTAGMRVMPGCEELMEIQHSYLARVSMSR